MKKKKMKREELGEFRRIKEEEEEEAEIVRKVEI